jgi:opacity protein-like surface antigen
MKKFLFLLLGWPMVAFSGQLSSAPTTVDESAVKSESPWKFRITPYGWLPSTSGSVGAGPLNAEANVSSSSIISKLQIGAMLDVEVDYERWSLENDIVFARLSSSTNKTQPYFGELKTTAYQVFWSSYLGYRVLDAKHFTMDLQAGFRLISLGVEGELTSGLLPGLSRSWSRTWVDPIVGLRTRAMITDWLFIPIRGDIGGFGANSELTWQALAGVGFQVSRWFGIVVGYRALGYQYDQANFRYDVTTHGPIIGLNFTF